MVDLFRYIEHDFAVPSKIDAIDVSNDSDFQRSLADAVATADGGNQTPGERVRGLASAFLDEHYPSPTSEPAALGAELAKLRGRVLALEQVDAAGVRAVVQEVFGAPAQQVTTGSDFAGDQELLQNAAVAIKLLTAFDRVNPARIARQVRSAALVDKLAADSGVELDRLRVRRLLSRPLRIPSNLLTATGTRRRLDPDVATSVPDSDGRDDVELEQLRAERDAVLEAFDRLAVLDPESVHLQSLGESGPSTEAGAGDVDADDGPDRVATSDASAGGESVLRLTEAGRGRLDDQHLEVIRSLQLDPDEAPVPVMLDRLQRRLVELDKTLLPVEVATQAPVIRVGAMLLLDPTSSSAPTAQPAASPDFSKAVTRPVGIGNLQVVRQQLIGYRPGAISHIENVLEGELLRRRTRRHEFTETFETLETTTSESRERDQQSTEHNELASETMRESGRQSSKSGDGLTSSDYGKLVENSKSNYAQTLVSKSVETITQQVHTSRGRREGRSYTERVRHMLDNTQGTKNVRGIYQWVDKEYSLRVLNYGKRLMYDVVVPEPAAVLVQTLQSRVQPESFALRKPLDPNLTPSALHAANYQWYAAQYGVTGSVGPPPAVFDTRTVSHVQPVTWSDSGPAYGAANVHVAKSGAFKLAIPDGYQALAGYVQMTNHSYVTAPGRALDVYVGESQYHRLLGPENPHLNVSFQMKGETGEVPVTWRTFAQTVALAFTTAIVCRRTDAAYAEWQLRTHATIVNGYRRQLADYEDKLGRYVAAFRAQVAAGGLGRDTKVALEELKRAFVFLLLGEHPGAWLPTPTPAPAPPGVALPDPVQVKEWGAVVAFFERAFEWENLMYTCYPYFWARPQRWQELMLMQDADPMFEAFLKAGAARVVVPVRPGFEAALAHFQETGDVWMGEEMPDMFGDNYLSIIDEIKAANFAPGQEVCVEQWKVTLPTTLVLLKDDAVLPEWAMPPCGPNDS